jgi:nucleoside-diphosphate-sugar epimerase
LADFNINGIIHLASQLSYANDLEYIDYYNGNVDTTRAVIKLSKEKSVKYVVFGSTCSMYGRQPPNGNVNENVLPDPTDNYGLTKYIAEKLLEIELQFVPTKVFVLRFTSIYGMNDRYGIVNTFTALAKQNKDIKLFGNGEKLRNLIHLSDAVNLIIKSIEEVDELGRHEIFIAGGQHSIKVFDLATQLIKLLNSESRIILAEERARVDWDPFIDISKANRILGFSPISVSEGLKQYVMGLS